MSMYDEASAHQAAARIVGEMHGHREIGDFADAAKTVSVPPYSDAFTRVEKALAEYSNIVDELESRLRPVLGPNTEARLVKETPAPEVEPAPIVGQTNITALRIESCNRALIDVLRRLAI